MKIDIIVPAYNEEESLNELFQRIKATISKIPGADFKVIFINDGSTDRTWQVMQDLAKENQENVQAISMRRNIGKAVALNVGFEVSTAEYVFTMDADLQDDPNEIPHFISKMNEGYDLVSGWKKTRHDPLGKTLPSKVFNLIVSKMTKIKLHDFNCGFKLYKSEVVKSLRLYGELHRFTPVLADAYGFKVAELEVLHHARKFGKSKYGFERFVRGLLDLISVVSTTRYLDRPGHLFGGFGILSGLVGGAGLSYLFVLKFIFGELIGHRPLLTISVMLVILSVQLVSLGILAELIVKNSSSNLASRNSKLIKSMINF